MDSMSLEGQTYVIANCAIMVILFFALTVPAILFLHQSWLARIIGAYVAFIGIVMSGWYVWMVDFIIDPSASKYMRIEDAVRGLIVYLIALLIIHLGLLAWDAYKRITSRKA